MSRLLSSSVTLALFALPSSAFADWEESAFSIVAVGTPQTELQPSLASGIDYPTEEECAIEPCALDEPVPVTKVAYVDTTEGELALVSRFGGVGEEWVQSTIWLGIPRHPTLVLDRDGGELITFLDMNSQMGRLKIARRTLPGQGNCGPSNSMYCRAVAGGNITMPAPLVVQYHAFDGSPTGAERRIHVVFSRDGALWHAFIEEDAFWAGASFEEYPIGGQVNEDTGEIEYDIDGVAGIWPAAAPTYANTGNGVPDELKPEFNWEVFPGVAYDDDGGHVAFRRANEKNWMTSPMMWWSDKLILGNHADQRPTVDTRHEAPVTAWAPGCSDGGGLLRYREADGPEPYSIFDWLTIEDAIAENACDASLSVGKYGAPHIAFVEPGLSQVQVTARPLENKPWGTPASVDEGAEPSMDYNPLMVRHSIAYTHPDSGELRVIDGFWL